MCSTVHFYFSDLFLSVPSLSLPSPVGDSILFVKLVNGFDGWSYLTIAVFFIDVVVVAEAYFVVVDDADVNADPSARSRCFNWYLLFCQAEKIDVGYATLLYVAFSV